MCTELALSRCSFQRRFLHYFMTESSADALREAWAHYGESHCVHIMVAAGLHVNESMNQLQHLHLTEIPIGSGEVPRHTQTTTQQSTKKI
jgi:hypothetical protein